MSRIKFKAAVAGLVVFSILFSTNLPAITFAQVSDPAIDLPGSVSPDLGAPASPPPGKSAATDPANVVIVLKPRNETAFATLAEAVSDPDSPRYQRAVTDAEFRQNYQPEAATVSSIKSYFTGQGFVLTYESSTELVLSFRTTLGQRDKAFGTTTAYRTNARGESGLINITPLQLPASVAKSVSGVLGFDELHRAKTSLKAIKPGPSNPPVARDSVSPVTPAQLRAAYNFPPTFTGTGTKVGVILWTAPDLSNTNRWKSDNGITGPVTVVGVDPNSNLTPDPGDLEAHMDIQMVLTAAPATAVRFYVARDSTFDSLGVALQKAVDDNVNSINGSWGNCEANISNSSKTAYTTIFQNGAAKGIPFFFSSGDSGAFECNTGGISQVGFSQFPASDPLATSVGGTSLDLSGSAWQNETAWSCNPADDTTCLQTNAGASTGGRAVFYPRPAYQLSFTPPTEPKFNNGAASTRLQPDLSMDGDPASGERVYTNGCAGASCPLGGGTSAASPFLAGIAALAVQQKGAATGSSNKFAYRNFPGNWGFDVTSGYNGVYAHPGWDYTTGLGSIKNVTNYLNAFTQPAPFLTASNPTIGEIAGNGNGSIDPGETIGLRVSLANSGDTAATGFTGTLTLTGGNATILNAASTYPNIPVGASANNDSLFTFSTAYTLPCASVLALRLTVSYNGGQTYIYDFSLTVGTASAGATQTFSNATPVAIPDNNAAGVASSINVPANFVAADVNVTVNITHTYDSDLVIKLIGPDNVTTVLLANHRGDAGDNFSGTTFDSQAATPIGAGTAPFGGSYQPELSLNTFNNASVNGTWKLFVADTSLADTGTLNSWSLALKPLTYGCTVYNPVPSLASLSPAKAGAGGAAFTLTVTGSNFVNGAVVQWNGANLATTFGSSSQLTAQVPAANITAVGGFAITVFNPAPGGGLSNSLTFSVVNPVPVLTSATAPPGTFAGSDTFVLTVNGSNFISGATVLWQNAARPTTFVSGSQLTALISSSDATAAGSFAVAVVNPAPGGGTSNAVSLSLGYTKPTLTAMTPDAAPNTGAGGHDFTLTIRGNFFVGGSVAYFNGVQHTTTYLNNHRLTIDIATTELPATGSATYPVAVVNPGNNPADTPLNFEISANCLPLVVTQPGEGSSCGYLRYALVQATTTNPKGAVNLAFSAGQTLTVSSSLNIPVGVDLNGVCTPTGPGIILNANGSGASLTLNGGTSLFGLSILNFGGPVMAQAQALTGGNSGNKLSCSRVSKG